MRARELKVKGAFEFTRRTFADDRGTFVSPFEESAFVDVVGQPLFAVAQASFSTSRRGVVRGVHYSATPPGTAKYVYCPRGSVLDVVVDIRVGSPTFRCWETVTLGGDEFRAVYLPVGVGHLFVALEDDTMMSYLLSQEYVPANELAISAFDPELGLPVPGKETAIVSERDSAAADLATAKTSGLLPTYDTCLRLESQFSRARSC